MHRAAGLDFLRGLAAWGVAIPHFLVYRSFHPEIFEIISVLGVEIFFVLSGYVLAPQILLCLSSRPSQLGVFLARRWMRTIPAYVTALVCISLLLNQFGSTDFFRYLFYVQNLYRQSNAEDYFSIAWSLSVEEWFYIVFPILMLGCVRLAGVGNRSVVTSAIIFIVVVTLVRTLFGPLDDWGPSVRRVVTFRIDSIAYGFLLYMLLNRAIPEAARKIGLGSSVLVLVVAAAFSYGTVALLADSEASWPRHAFPFMAAIFGSSCIVVALRAEPAFASSPAWTRGALFIGQISYSVYLFHMIFMIVLSPLINFLPLGAELVLFVLTLAAFAAVFYRGFERPILLARPEFKSMTAKLA